MHWKTTYITDLALYFFRGSTGLQMSVTCDILITLHNWRRLCRFAGHILVGVTGSFYGAGVGAEISGSCKGC